MSQDVIEHEAFDELSRSQRELQHEAAQVKTRDGLPLRPGWCRDRQPRDGA